jgi:hypothetical protein
MTYDLRRLRLHGVIRRIDKSQRYELTPAGLKTALFYSRTYTRVIRSGLSLISAPVPSSHSKLKRAFHQFESELNRYLAQQKAA